MVDESKIISKLRSIVGSDYVLTDEESLYTYSYDASSVEVELPIAVVLPKNAREVSEIVKLANEMLFPIIPRGSGTSLSGSSTPTSKSVVVDLSRMNRVIEVNVVDGYVTVEAGVKIEEVNEVLRPHGYFFPPDPASSAVATVGGCIASNSGGIRGAKFGPVKNWVLQLEVVLPTGEIVVVGNKTSKWRQGYDLVSLLVGSEGTLGIITKAVLKIWPLPEGIVRILAFFKSVSDAGRAVYEIKKERITPLALEIIDKYHLEATSKYAGVDVPRDAEAALLVDVDGPREALNRYAKRVEEILEGLGAFRVEVATDPEEMEKLYKARKAGYASLLRSRIRPHILLEDLTVPPSKLPEVLEEIYSLARKYELPIAVQGHAGDGNLHPVIFADLKDPVEREKAFKLFRSLGELAIRCGGAISGEHGIGVLKKELLVKEFEYKNSLKALEVMKAIKRVLDPNNIMNPGKIF